MKINLFNGIFFCLLLSCIRMPAQVGIPTTTPRGIVDLNQNDGTNYYGFVLPANADPNNIRNPISGSMVANGTLIYDSTEDCVKFFKKVTQTWSNCLMYESVTDPDPGIPTPIVSTLECRSSLASSGISGQSYNKSGQFIAYTGGNGKLYPSQNIISSGVLGLTMKIDSGNLANGNGSLNVTISGIPSNKGIASFNVNFGGKTCIFNITINSAGPIPGTQIFYSQTSQAFPSSLYLVSVGSSNTSDGAIISSNQNQLVFTNNKVYNFNWSSNGLINVYLNGQLKATQSTGSIDVQGPNTIVTASCTGNCFNRNSTFKVIVQ